MAADRRELRSFGDRSRGFQRCSVGLRWSALGTLHGRRVLLAANGSGRRNAAQAVRLACRRFDIGCIVCTGYAGALDPGLRVGDAFLADRVIQFEGRVEYPVRLPTLCDRASSEVGTLLTMDEFVRDAEMKARLWSAGAQAVDMEAAAVAAEAEARQLPFFCVRAISDDAKTSFELDFGRALGWHGAFSGWRVIALAGISSKRWKELLTLRRGAEAASQTLAALFERCDFDF